MENEKVHLNFINFYYIISRNREHVDWPAVLHPRKEISHLKAKIGRKNNWSQYTDEAK